MSSTQNTSQNPPGTNQQQQSNNQSTSQPVLRSDEDALLADFDRFIQSDIPLEAAPPTSPPTSNDALPPLPKPPSQSMAVLKAKFPKLNYDSLSAALVASNNNIEEATNVLVQSGACTHDDQKLAQRLQSAEESNQTTTRTNTTSVRHRRNNANLPLTSSTMQKLVNALREIIIPSLRAHFEQLSLPDTKEESSSFQYSLEQIQVINLSMPLENVGITPATDSQAVYVNIVNTYLELQIGKWSYKNNAIVPINDSGRARVSLHRMNISITLEPRWAHAGGTRIIITDCAITVDGPVRLKTFGAAADWAYNAIAIVMKPLVVSYLKEAISDSVTTALANHLRQLAFAYSLDEQSSQQNSHHTNNSAPTVTTAELI